MRQPLALLALAAVVAALLLQRGASDPPTPLAKARAAEAPPADTLAHEPLDAAPVRVAGAAFEAAAVTPAAPAILSVRVVDTGGVGVYGASVVLLRPRTGGSTRLESRTTDPEGFAELAVPSGQPLTIQAGGLGEMTTVEVEIEPLAPAATHEQTIEVTHRSETAAEVLVRVRTEDGAPVAGAELHTWREGALHSGSPPRVVPPQSSPAAVTDVEGEASVATEALALTVALVRASGFAPQYVSLREPEASASPPSPVEVVLAPAARAEGHVSGAPAGAMARAITPSYGMHVASSTSAPLFGSEVRFEAEVRGDGTFTLEDLPTGAPLRFELAHDGRALVVEPDAVSLGAGQVHRLEWRVGVGAVARCVAREDDGAAASDIEVWLLSTDEGRPGLAESYWTPTQRRRTDAGGVATFDPVRGGAWVVALAPREGGADSADSYAPLAVRVELDEAAQVTTVELAVTRGRTIRGVVLDPSGAPVRANVTAHGPGGIFLNADDGPDGTFTVGPLIAGTYALKARVHFVQPGDPSFGPSAPVQVEAGTADVVLRLQPGCTLTVTASRNGERVPAWFTAVAAPSLSAQGFYGQAAQERRSVGLGLGSYVVTATTNDGFVGVVAPYELVSAGDHTLDVPLVPSGRVRIRNRGPHRHVNCVASVRDNDLFAGTAPAGGEEVFHLPAGPARIRLSVFDDGSSEQPRPRLLDDVREVVVLAGEDVWIDVPQ